ncbi:MAG: DUF4197 domain-containing protein [Nitrospina sp.]|nr:DUF4197 domain-containing protein [Nitrospina sp.]
MRYKFISIFALLIFIFNPGTGNAQFFDNLMKKGMDSLSQDKPLSEMGTSLSEDSIISGLKEALEIGVGKSIDFTSRLDGYVGNPKIKIPMPEKIQNVADMLGKIGLQKPVDDFVLSMNRAAEAASPKAKEFLLSSIKQMTFDDAKKILEGGDTAATDYLKTKTFDDIFGAFKPTVSEMVNKVGVTSAYKEMMGKFSSIPFASAESLDLDNYVTDKAISGLFLMLGEEEKNIRTDPKARVTDLLKNVFGK